MKNNLTSVYHKTALMILMTSSTLLAADKVTTFIEDLNKWLIWGVGPAIILMGVAFGVYSYIFKQDEAGLSKIKHSFLAGGLLFAATLIIDKVVDIAK